MLRQRIASAIVAVPLVLWSVYTGGWPFMLVLSGLAIIGWKEIQAMQSEPDSILTWLGGLFLLVVLYVAWRWPEYVLASLTFAVFSLLVTLLWRYDSKRWQTVSHSVSSFCYLSLPLVHLIWLGNLPGGWRWLILLLVCVWCYDSFAYFVGNLCGRRKLWKRISPNKSLEGVGGGLTGSALAATLLLAWLLPELGWLRLLAFSLPFGIGVGILAQTGDLLESALKRTFAIKDSGQFLPGHGGLLDRVDSILFTTPFVYYFLKLLII